VERTRCGTAGSLKLRIRWADGRGGGAGEAEPQNTTSNHMQNPCSGAVMNKSFCDDMIAQSVQEIMA
jgi:hypothetical protein